MNLLINSVIIYKLNTLEISKVLKFKLCFREVDPTGYKYYLESPISTTQRIEEDRITYVNKGRRSY